MHVTLLVPDLHDLQTGGNVYNRQMAGEMRTEGEVQVLSWAPGERPLPDLPSSGEDVVVVDSLLVRHSGAIQAVRAARSTATVVLLVHYLRCIDPTVKDGDEATAERTALAAVDGAVTTSRFARQALMDEGVPAERVVVVPPGLDGRYRGALPDRSRQAIPRMLTVANLVPEKGIRQFVDVLRNLRSRAWHWILVGDSSLDPDYAESVHRRIRETGLSGRVTHTGPVSPDALRTWYDRADLFVLPSRFETRSLSMREAMARGLPVVSYRVGGVAENVGETTAGHLVPPSDPALLRSVLRILLTDPMARRQKGRAAWRRSQAFPTWAEAADRFQSTLAELGARATDEE